MMPTAPLPPALPETVSPGQLITADLINKILAALRGYQNLSTSYSTLAQAVTDIDTRVKSIEDLIDTVKRKNNEISGVMDSLRHDRDEILVKLNNLRGEVVPELRKHFDDIESNIAERFEPFERRMGEVELRATVDTDPIDRLPGMTREHIDLLHSRGIENVADLKAHRGEIADIVGNDLDAVRIGNMIERIG